jgi:hypothetical protein
VQCPHKHMINQKDMSIFCTVTLRTIRSGRTAGLYYREDITQATRRPRKELLDRQDIL